MSSAPSQPQVIIRRATVDDAAGIAEIYNAEVLKSTSTMDMVPRTIDEQRDWIQRRSGAFSAIVACDETTGEVVGFASLSKYKERAAYSTTVEDSVYVARDHHGRGIGQLLLTAICDTARDGGFHSIIARIEASGEGSLALHRSVGFELLGIERQVGRKFNRWLDVAVMQLML